MLGLLFFFSTWNVLAGVDTEPAPGAIRAPSRALPAPDGTVWVSSYDGTLYRIEGGTAHVYGPGEGMPQDSALSVWVDDRGEVWVGTDRGLFWVDGDRVRRVPGVPGPVFAYGDGPGGRAVVTVQGVSYAALLDVREGLPVAEEIVLPSGVSARNATVLPDGSFYVGTAEHGLFRYRDGHLVPIPGTEGTKAGPFVVVGGALFFGTGNGLAKWDGRLTRYLAGNYITGLLHHGGAIYVGTDEGKLIRIREEMDGAVTEELGQGPPSSLFALCAAGGRIYGATWGGGLVRYDPRTGVLDTIGGDDGIGDGVVQALAVDREGALWITTSSGVRILARHDVDRFGVETIGSNNVFAVSRSGGRLLVGTEEGLAILEDGRWIRRGRADGLASSAVASLVPLTDGRVLIGGPGHGEGVAILAADASTIQPVTAEWGAPDGRWGYQIGALPGGRWLVERHSHQELLEVAVDGAITRRVQLPEGQFVNGISTTAAGAWLSTSFGLFRWEDGLVDAGIELLDKRVGGIAFGGETGWLWYTFPAGLVRFDRDGQTLFAQDRGLPSAGVDWVWPMEDGAWVGTSGGVVRIVGEEVVRPAGLPSRSSDGLVDEQGALWVASSEGLFRYAPWLGGPVEAPLRLLVDARIGGRPLDGAVVPWDARDVEVVLDAATYFDRDGLRYRWSIGDQGAPWSSASRFYVAGLEPGEHRLRVEARAADGRTAVWEAGFQVLPPWWRTRSFVALCSVLLVGVGVGIGRVRSRRMAKERARLEVLVEERTAELASLAQELERASMAKSRYLADMSHELRTPLNAIIGYTELIAEEARDEGMSFIVEDTNRVEVAARHLLALINDVLDLSKIEAGKLEFNLEDVDVAQTVEDVCVALAPVVAQNRNRLQVETEPATARVDAHRLRQILTNLVGNASKFTEDGTITVRVRNVDERVRIEVEDTGIGMAPEVLERLFQPFAQASAETASTFGGTGLGLVISRELAVAMGGDIRVRSVEGEGSVFTVELPSACPPPPH